ncbi:MAG: hypothetical protein JJU16_00745 [Alkalibacterium sp.]|nr:hypothetical protein [Alkalibacterium sp.]
MNLSKSGFTLAAFLLLSACTTETVLEDPQTDETVSVEANGEEDTPQINTIVPSQLTNREEAILFTTSSQSLVFDFNVEPEFTEANVWIEKYEYGEPSEYTIGHTSMDIVNNGYIVFSSTENYSVSNEILIRLGLSSGYSSAHHSTSDTLPGSESADEESDNDGISMGTIWEAASSDEMDLSNGEVVLGSLIHTNMEEGVSGLTQAFYADVEGHIEEIEDYGLVYLIKAEFLKDDQGSQD